MKIELTQEQLDDTISILEFAQSRLEQEASALLNVRAGRDLAVTRLGQAKKAADLVDFYLHQ